MFRNSAMMKHPAPMIGGMIWPPEDAEASMAPAREGGNPSRFIVGMVKDPVVAAFATEEPESMPKKELEMTATWPAPPRSLPPVIWLISMKVFPTPVAKSTGPNSTNNAIRRLVMSVSSPHMPSLIR